ncbi:Exodeoxyribonuclease 7 large subunit, partial [Bienertia sinuspersici]
MHTSQPILPRSNRQYVTPLMLARGRGSENVNGFNNDDMIENAGGDNYENVDDNGYENVDDNDFENIDENDEDNPLEEPAPDQQLDVFTNENMELYRQHVLDHMRELWTNWRSDLLRYNVKKKEITLQVAQNNKPPNGLDKNEQVIWKDLGANNGLQPDMVDVYFTTRKKGTSLPNPETAQKYVAQRVFKSKSRDRPVGFGGGIKLKDIKGPQPSREKLEVELNATKEQNQLLASRIEAMNDENNELRSRVGSVEAQLKKFEEMLMNQHNDSATLEKELDKS